MRALAAGVLMLLGLVIGLWGVFLALDPMLSLYAGALADPLGEAGAPERSGPEVRDAMLSGVAVGAAGLVPLGAGLVLWKTRRARARRRRLR